ncbi:MAG: flagellar hook-basal body complex protein [Cereibacter changlensis]|uniref:Flagellar hook protein FlgE n=2 Tax=Cereibacter changlensis TaxID=402884 RepID=A0A2T4JXP7_9RHOB|nr:flagellar hook-basal body complex protein [Cereibacter changlensis]PTE22684.1 flagellar biosynthesis protein FlgE [Cereibacter changlensis JA139]PZX58935.1 flagellar hook protein FlgE [Cereibacter changlensis]
MTISSSLNAGVAGLNANATRLATIADNIANSGTFGYKRAAADFDSMVITGSSGSGTYSAGGVRANTMRLIDERGAVIATSNPMDIAIAGRGMLPVISSSSLNSMSGDRPLMMTTTGSFRTDADGVLMTQSGLVLMGWPADADGTIASMPRDTMVGLEPVVINANQTAGDPTTEINMGINLPAVDTEFGASGAARTTSIEYFGNLGTSETLDVTFTPSLPALATDPGTNTWTMVITDSASGGAVVGEYTLVFNDSRTNGGTLNSVTAIGASPVYDAAAGSVTLTVEGGPIEVTVGKVGDTNGLTQLSSSFAPTSITKDGSPVGNLTAVEIDESGFIQATYDTGFTRVIYQIPLVDVPNPNGLIAMNDQTFEVSPVSGSFFLWDAGDGPTGSIVGYAREGSTTDVAAELTNLIQTQRAYSSNAKIIQTVDEMLQETTNIKR